MDGEAIGAAAVVVLTGILLVTQIGTSGLAVFVVATFTGGLSGMLITHDLLGILLSTLIAVFAAFTWGPIRPLGRRRSRLARASVGAVLGALVITSFFAVLTIEVSNSTSERTGAEIVMITVGNLISGAIGGLVGGISDRDVERSSPMRPQS